MTGLSIGLSTGRMAALLDGLNPQQRSAVEHRGGPLLVLAGAGSGKTRVITVRIAHFIAQGTPGERILALTFTNKAAGEMAERVAGLVGEEQAARMTVGTFHSLGLRILEEDGRHLGMPRFTLLDAADQASAMRQVLKGLNLDPKRHDPHLFLSIISNARNAGVTPEAMRRDPTRRLQAKIYAAYLEHLRAYRAADFDDLILRPIELLREHEVVRAKWCGRFDTVLVDEFQDTNGAQLELVTRLVEPHRSVCVVGDDDQSIYGWRGARIENILGFERHFHDAAVIRLEQNYRSTGHILKAANAVIAANTERKVKALWTDQPDGEPVRVVRAADARAEAAFVAGQVSALASRQGFRWRDFGVLFRTSAQSDALADALRLAGVPYRVVGAYDFYERKEVRDVLSYLKLVVNPSDRMSLLRVINFPTRGIGPKSLNALLDFAAHRRMSPVAALAHVDEIPAITGRAREGMRAFASVLERAGARWERERDLAGLARWVIEAAGAREAWIRDPTEGPGGQARWRNIERLLASMQAYQDKRPGVELKDFLRLIALDKQQGGDKEEADDVVSLMTLHAAKGLEWPVCFVVGCQEGLIPHQRTIEDAGGDVSEERRLFYVGITRARRLCYLTHARVRRKFHGSEPARPSRFLRDIPAAHRLDDDRSVAPAEPDRAEVSRRFAELRARLAKL